MRRHVLASVLLAATATLAGCGDDPDPGAGAGSGASSDAGGATGASPSSTVEPPPLTGQDVHWGYSGEIGPRHWADLSADFAACETGDQQSPIDLDPDAARGSEAIVVDYGDVPDHVVNNGHSIQLFADADAELEVAGTDYALDQFHFHAPSEHTVAGRHFPVEFHFVNTDAEGHTTVLGVFATRGPRANADWAPFVAAASTPVDAEVPGEIDLSRMLPASLEHFSYDGSLTTPPCTQGVHWAVLTTPVELGAAQIRALDSAYVHNNRPLQDAGDRPVLLAAGRSD